MCKLPSRTGCRVSILGTVSMYQMEVLLMRNLTAICYLFSLLSFGMGYSKILVYKNAIIEQVNTYDYTINLSLATSFLVVAIFLAVVGFALYTLTIKGQKINSESDISNRVGNQKRTMPRKNQSVYSCDG